MLTIIRIWISIRKYNNYSVWRLIWIKTDIHGNSKKKKGMQTPANQLSVTDMSDNLLNRVTISSSFKLLIDYAATKLVDLCADQNPSQDTETLYMGRHVLVQNEKVILFIIVIFITFSETCE